MTVHDWADREAADILTICATGGFNSASCASIAKRLREIADARITDHQAGIERAFDRVFGPEEAVAP
jgi:hypothetical protein